MSQAPTESNGATPEPEDFDPDAPRKFGFETRMLHAGHIPDAITGSRAVPIYQSTSFVFDDAQHAAELFELKQYGNIYTRISNPTTAVLEERVASLENATGALATASGMGAQMTTFMTMLEPGDEIVSSTHIYGGTATQFAHTFKKLGIKVHFVDPTKIENWEAAITPRTRALFGETIGNPKGSILDIEKIAGLADSKKMPLVIDNTFATPYLCRPIDWGASIVLHSATKFLGGHGTSIAGIICDSGDFDWRGYPTISEPSPAYHDLRFYDTFGHYGFLTKARAETVRDIGTCVSPMNAWLILQGVETLALRMDRHVENARRIAEYLKGHANVEWVSYAGLPDHPDHALAQKYMRAGKGPGAVFSFGLKPKPGQDVREAGKVFIESLELFSHLANVGDARSLVIHPATTTHQQLSDEELEFSGIGPEMIRLSVGLETTEDLLWDLDQAFHAMSA